MGSNSNGRKSGGQPGNLNSLKHGFYSKQLRGLDVASAQRIETELSEEIAVYRAMLQRYLYQFTLAHNGEEMGRILELAGRAFTRLGNLVRIQHSIQSHSWDDDLQSVIARVLEDMDAELAAEFEFEELTGSTEV